MTITSLTELNALLTRALDCLEGLVDAVTQMGPDSRDIDVDYDALASVVADADVVLYKAGRRLP